MYYNTTAGPAFHCIILFLGCCDYVSVKTPKGASGKFDENIFKKDGDKYIGTENDELKFEYKYAFIIDNNKLRPPTNIARVKIKILLFF